MNWWAVVFGWPAIVGGLVACCAGAASRSRPMMLLGAALLAAPTLYFAGTPRFGVAAVVVACLLVAACVTVARLPRVTWACVVGTSGFYAVVAWLALSTGGR